MSRDEAEISEPGDDDDDDDSNSDWEYEYHDTETEDVYITLDFIADPKAGSARSSQGAGLLGLPARGTSKKANVQAQSSDPQDGEIRPSTVSQNHDTVEDSHGEVTQNTTSQPQGQLQIIELHSDNPIIAYNESLYQCHWSQTLGTDMYFIKTPPSSTRQALQVGTSDQPQTIHVPLRQLKENQLLGLGVAKLIAMPAQLRVKPMANPPTVPDDLKIELASDAPGVQKRQAQFLERFAAIKRAKGETDAVPRAFAGTWARGRRRGAGSASNLTAARSGSRGGRRRANKSRGQQFEPPFATTSSLGTSTAAPSAYGMLVPSTSLQAARSTPGTFFGDQSSLTSNPGIIEGPLMQGTNNEGEARLSVQDGGEPADLDHE